MGNFWLVGVGGFAGSVARFYLSGAVTRLSHASRFPYGTLVVNVAGCLLIGLIASLAEHQRIIGPATRLFLITGFLGGFTTYSAFAFETWFLGREQLFLAAAGNVALQTVVGLGAVILGSKMGTLIAG